MSEVPEDMLDAPLPPLDIDEELPLVSRWELVAPEEPSEDSEVPMDEPVCAKAIEDTEAMTTNDRERRVFLMAMIDSLDKKKAAPASKCRRFDEAPSELF